MTVKTLLKKAMVFLLGINLGILIRALRFGVADAREQLWSAYHGVDPLKARDLDIEPADTIAAGNDKTSHPAAESNHEAWNDEILSTSIPVEALSYNKLCNLADFQHPDLVPWIRAIFSHERERFGPAFPVGFEDRRQWEVAMTLRTFFDHGVLNERSEVLGVGAGNEPTIFFLTNRVKRVFATDLYVTSGSGWAEADVSMIRDPGLNWPFSWNPRRLVVQHMDGRMLRYDDESFDGVFSCGSIEHFGTLDQIQRSSREMYRVLKPGGILAIATEFRIEGPDLGFPGTVLFTPELIKERIIGTLAWRPLSPFDYRLSPKTLQTALLQSEAMKAFRKHVKKYGRLLYHKLRQASYPIVVMREGPYVWTSISIALRKN